MIMVFKTVSGLKKMEFLFYDIIEPFYVSSRTYSTEYLKIFSNFIVH